MQHKRVIMSRLIKLIWDFRGSVAEHTAKHHLIHLKEFIATENISITITGTEKLNELYSIAFIVVTEDLMIPMRDQLKPHRGEVYEV